MKEKIDREIRVKVQASLHDAFQTKCEEEFKTVSIVIRDLMAKYLKQKEGHD